MAITRFPLETDQPIVEVTLPPGQHVLELVVEDSAGLRSEPDTITITIENVLPVISGIDPAGARQGDESVTATISGLNLVKVQTVSFADGGISVKDITEKSPEELQVVLSVDPDATPGSRGFTVTTEAGSVDSPAGVTFSVDEGLPVLSAINPDTGQPGDTDLKLAISGRYLKDVKEVVFLDGGIKVNNFTERSPESLEVVVSIDPAATDGPRRFRVATDEGTTESSAQVVFTVKAPLPQLPVIEAISPNSARAGETVFAAILGQNLANAQSVKFIDPQLLISATISAGGTDTKLPVTLQIDKSAAAGSYRFSVTTAAGTVTSSPDVTFTVQAQLPTLEPTRIVPTEIVPTGITPTGIVPTRITPTEIVPTSITPTGIVPTRITPTGIVPTSITPTGIVPTRITPTGIVPTSITPTGIVPTSITPTGIVPTSISPTLITPSAVLPTSIVSPPILGPTILSAKDFPGRNVQEVKGIGPATAELLKKKRITNLAHLASTEPGKLAEILDISEVRAMEFVAEARRLLTEDKT